MDAKTTAKTTLLTEKLETLLLQCCADVVAVERRGETASGIVGLTVH